MGWPYQQKPPMGWPLDLDSGLVPDVGFWPMLAGSGNTIQDLSGNGNTGTITPANVFWGSGKYGPHLDFTATDDAVTCGNNPALGLTGGKFTIYVVFNTDTIIANDVLVGKHDAGVNGWELEITSLLRFRWNNTADNHVQGSTLLSTGVVTHAACTFDGTTPRLYLNGKDDTDYGSTAVADSAPNGHAGDLWMGQLYHAGLWEYDGKIEAVYIYDRVLSPSEIAEVYSKPFCMFMNPDEVPLLDQYYTVTEGGIMTPNTRYWGAL